MQQTERDEFKHIVSYVKEMYGIDNLVEEALAWYDVQKHKPLDDNSGYDRAGEADHYVPCCAQGYPHRTDSACNIMYSGNLSISLPRPPDAHAYVH